MRAPAKTTRPNVVGALARRRLFRLLDRRRPLFWITGPAGAGKTTLVSTYLAARRLHGLWYQLDESDADAGAFFYYLSLAARRAAPRTRRPLPLLKPEYWPDLSRFTRRYFRELYARLRAPFALTLDNYHEVHEASPLHDVIRDGVLELPDGGRLIIISRNQPPASLARLRAAGAVMSIGWQDLRLTATEARGLSRLRDTKLSRSALARLHARTHGWAAGITLMLGDPSSADVRPPALDARAPRLVFDYFAAETLKRLAPTTEQFLLESVFLPRMTPRAAAELTGVRDAEKILAQLHASNYFTERREQPETVYQYHALFREFLEARARDTLPRDRLADVQRRAATLLTREGQVEEAIRLLREAEDWDGLAELLVGQAASLIAQGRSQTFEEWANGVPEAQRDDAPWLQYWLGVARLPFSSAAARRFLERAFALFERADDSVGSFSTWSAAVDSLLFEQGDFTRLDPWIAALERLRERHPTFPAPEIEAQVSSSMLAALMFRQPHHPEIASWAERAHAFSQWGTVDRRMLTGYALLQYHLWMGHQAKAAIALAMLRELARDRDASPLVKISYHAADANYHWHLAGSAQCLEAAAAGQRIAHESGVHLLDVNLFAQSVYGALVAGDSTAVRERLRDMVTLAQRGHAFHTAHYHFLAAWESLIRRDLPVALEHTNYAMRHAVESGTPFPQAWNHIGLAHILLESGDASAAIMHLAAARQIARPIGSRMLDYMLLLVDAHVAWRGGDDEVLLAALRMAMRIGREQGFVIARWWQPALMATLCARALDAGVEIEYVRRLIRTHRLVPDPPPLEEDGWPWSITVRTLGSFELRKDGAVLASSGKAQRRPLALLEALIAFGGRNVSEERLGDTLWPEAPGDAARQALATTLHRLRILLGEERVVRVHQRHLSLDPRHVWLDTWAFERLLDDADRALATGRASDARTRTERALALYRGSFLGTRESDDWVLSARERLRAKFLRATSWLARHWLESGAFERAVACYERGLEVDDLAEEFYQGLMSVHHRRGRPSAALEVYDRCRRTLAATLNVAPSAATEALHRELQHA